MRKFQEFLKVNEQEDLEMNPLPSDIDTDTELEVEPVALIPAPQNMPAPQGESPSAEGIMDHLRSLVEFQVQVKVMHWGTESFAQHKATCDTYASLDAAIDALVESYQGYTGRIKIGGQYTILNYEDMNLDPWLDSAMEHTNALRGMIEYSDVLNLLDEILAILTKFKYLLSLK